MSMILTDNPKRHRTILETLSDTWMCSIWTTQHWVLISTDSALMNRILHTTVQYVWLLWLSGHTSGSPAAVRQRSGQQGCAWRGSASPEHCTPPSLSHGCGPVGRGGASLLVAADWLLKQRGNISVILPWCQELSSLLFRVLLIAFAGSNRHSAHLCSLPVQSRSSWRVSPAWFPLNLQAEQPPPPSATGGPEPRPSWPECAPVMETKSHKSYLTYFFFHNRPWRK